MWEFEAGLGMVASKIHLAGRDAKEAVDEMDQPVRQITREVRTEVRAAVLDQAAGDVDAGIFLGGHLDVGVGLVIAEQDVEAGLVLLDEVVFKGQRLLLVIDQDVIDVAGFGDERSGFGIGQTVDRKVTANAVAQVLRLADVDGRDLLDPYTDTRRARGVSELLFHGALRRAIYFDYVIAAASAGRWAEREIRLPPAKAGDAKTQPAPATKTGKAGAAANPPEEAPPEEDQSVAPKEYAFNPIQAAKEVRVGDYYMKRGKYRAAAERFEEATKWNGQLADAFRKLGEAQEKQEDGKAAREAYQHFLDLNPDAKAAAEVRKRMEKLGPA